MQIDGQTFLISGGSSGLGRACARLLAARGGNVVIADIERQRGGELAGELGERARFAPTDVTDEAAVGAAVDAAVAAFGGLHGAISCAGIGVPEKVLGKQGPHRLATFMQVININLVGTFNVLRLAARAMAANQPNGGGERGVIVNTASVAAYEGQVGQTAYSASKGGIVGMTLPAARDLAQLGIRVMTIAPGIFDTPMVAGLPEEVRASLGRQTPFPPRLGRPEEFAQLVQQIVENEMLNGEVIRLDGAIRMAPR
jgi:NAD(P)-dependent dehydrogenase (short-subunit alcohol dehydrogenase family)